MTLMAPIRITCNVQTFASIDDLIDFQGELKSLSTDAYKSLKKSILKHGFHTAIDVWEDEDGKLQILDGHQRKRTLMQMQAEGFELPPIPIVKIEAPSWQEAKRILLTKVSQYGKVETQGLYEFAIHSQIDIEEFKTDFNIPIVSMDVGKFEAEYFKDTTSVTEHERKLPGEGEKELDENIATEHECPSCGYKW